MADALLTRPAPFDAVADGYDEDFTNSLIGRAQRRAVWRELDRAFCPGQRVLELNCGTGVDAIHLANRGVEVLACDISPRMTAVARARLESARLAAKVEFRVLATEVLAALDTAGPLGGAFSNFAGLNCVRDLRRAVGDLARLLRPGAPLLLTFFGRFSLWEACWNLVHLMPRKAFRRLRPSATARLAGGVTIDVYYPSVREIRRAFAPEFRFRRLVGIGVAVPPTALEPLMRRWEPVVSLLARADRILGHLPLVRILGDHVLLQFERTDLCRT